MGLRKLTGLLCQTITANIFRCSEHDLRTIFDRFGKVQTCIVNKEKRHAFVKMISRKDAVNAKDSMESSRSPDSQLRVCFVILSANCTGR